ncbi:MAG: hypothetical protein ACKODX_11340 [Gemmata sp.]
MRLLRSMVIAATLALGAAADRAEAGGLGVPCAGCGHSGGFRFGSHFGGLPAPQRETLFNGSAAGHNLFAPKPKLPVFQAAPWYQYWPYDGHFMTPAPVTGAFYAPPITGNFPVNPYFPGAQPNYGFGAYPTPSGPPVPVPQPMPSPGR